MKEFISFSGTNFFDAPVLRREIEGTLLFRSLNKPNLRKEYKKGEEPQQLKDMSWSNSNCLNNHER